MTASLKIKLAAGAALAALSAGSAQAQSLSSNSASFNAGWGRGSGSDNNPSVNTFARDASGNRVIIDGVIQTGADQSSFHQTDGGAGAGFGGATAIGNNLSVITQGNWNTVIVDSTQINNGDVTANTTVDGGDQSNGG